MNRKKIEEYFYLVTATVGLLLATVSSFEPKVEWNTNLLLFIASAYGIWWGLRLRKKRLGAEKQQ
jgi:uncharacterized membrane protein YfcA